MKAFTTLLCTMVALASAAAVPYDYASDDVVEREVAAALGDDAVYDLLATRDEGVDIVTQDLPDGSNKVEIVVDGISNGYLVIDANGDVHGFQGNGTEVNLDDVLAARDLEDSGVERRSLAWLRVLAKLAPVIKKFGSRVISWLKCVGAWSQILDCSSKLINCATYGQAPWECVSGIACIGKAAKRC